jgi:hypothetical protein
MKSERDGINPAARPSGTGCVECLAAGGWWLHLRRCAECGHIGCCDSSPNQHASKHYAATGHPIIASFEPDEGWFYDYRTEESFAGPKLHAPHAHPLDQPVPGPAGAVPSNWQALVHEKGGGFSVSDAGVRWPPSENPTRQRLPGSAVRWSAVETQKRTKDDCSVIHGRGGNEDSRSGRDCHNAFSRERECTGVYWLGQFASKEFGRPNYSHRSLHGNKRRGYLQASQLFRQRPERRCRHRSAARHDGIVGCRRLPYSQGELVRRNDLPAQAIHL